MRIAIFTAMDSERERLAAMMRGGRIGRHEVTLVRTGIGKVNAAAGATELFCKSGAAHFDCAASTGCAGGLATGLKPGDTVAASEIAHHDVWCGEPNAWGQVPGFPPRFQCDAGLVAAARAVPAVSRVGLFASGDRFVESEDDARSIVDRFPDAIAIDMESAALAQVCFRHGVPFISLRVLSDAPGADKRAMQYDTFWREMADISFGATRDFLENLPDRP